MTDGYG